MNIWNGIAIAINSFLVTLLNTLPNADVTVIAKIAETTDTIHNAIAQASWLFPVNTLLTIFGLMIIVETANLTYRLIKLIYNLNPTGSKIT